MTKKKNRLGRSPLRRFVAPDPARSVSLPRPAAPSLGTQALLNPGAARPLNASQATVTEVMAGGPPDITDPLLFTGEVAKSGSWQYAPFFKRPYNPSDLWQKRSNYTLYDEIRVDDQVHAALHMKKLLTLGTGWEITADESETETKEGVEYALREYLQGGLEALLFNILSAMDYGVSYTEKIAKVVEEGRWAGKIMWSMLKTRPPHGILAHTDVYGNIEKLTQDREDLPYSKFIHYVHQAEFDNPYGKSDINTGVYRAWWSKDRIIGYQNMYLESRAFPTMWGKYPKNFKDKDRTKLLDVLKAIQARTAFVTPEETDVSILKGADSAANEAFKQALDYFDLRIARAVLVPDLMGMSGSKTSGGSFSLGQEQFSLFYAVLEHERLQLTRTVNEHLVRALIEWNWGDYEESTVRFKFKPLTQADAMEQAKTWALAIGSKWDPTPEEVDHFRQIVGFPEGEVNLTAKPVPVVGGVGPDGKPLAPTPPKPGDKPAGSTEKEGATEKNKPPAPKKDEMEHRHGALRVYAERTTAERRVNFEEIKSRLDGAESALSGALSKVVKDGIRSMVQRIADRRIIEKQDVAGAAEPPLPKSMVPAMRSLFKNAFTEQLDHGYDEAEKEVTGRTYALTGGVGGLTWPKVKELLDYKAELSSLDIWDRITKTTTPILLEGVKQGWSVRETMKQLDGALLKFDDEYGAPWLETVARTNLMSVFNEGRAQAFKDNSDEIAAYQISAVLDGRTSEICLSLDSKVIAASDLDKWTPPYHYQCRTVLVAILTGEDFQLSRMPNMTMQDGGFLSFAKSGPQSAGKDYAEEELERLESGVDTANDSADPGTVVSIVIQKAAPFLDDTAARNWVRQHAFTTSRFDEGRWSWRFRQNVALTDVKGRFVYRRPEPGVTLIVWVGEDKNGK